MCKVFALHATDLNSISSTVYESLRMVKGVISENYQLWPQNKTKRIISICPFIYILFRVNYTMFFIVNSPVSITIFPPTQIILNIFDVCHSQWYKLVYHCFNLDYSNESDGEQFYGHVHHLLVFLTERPTFFIPFLMGFLDFLC